MSRVFHCEVPDECKPWKSPNLKSSDGNDRHYDYKFTRAEGLTIGEQQEIIRQQSFEKSYAKGYMEGLNHGKKELQEQYSNLQSLMATLVMPQPNLDNQVVDELVQLCLSISRQVVRRELKTSPDEIIAVVREAMDLLPVTTADITLELHPEDARLIDNAFAKPDSKPGWKIIEDPFMTRGGCRVATSSSRIDATVEKRINSVVAQIMGGERKEDSTP